MHSCVIWHFVIFFSTAYNGYRNQAANDDWPSIRWTICDGIYDAAGYAHSSCCKSTIGSIRRPIKQEKLWLKRKASGQTTQDIPHTYTLYMHHVFEDEKIWFLFLFWSQCICTAAIVTSYLFKGSVHLLVFSFSYRPLVTRNITTRGHPSLTLF